MGTSFQQKKSTKMQLKDKILDLQLPLKINTRRSFIPDYLVSLSSYNETCHVSVTLITIIFYTNYRLSQPSSFIIDLLETMQT